MAIALGLNLTPVVRLTKTWGKVKSNKLTLLKVSFKQSLEMTRTTSKLKNLKTKS